MSPIRAEEEEEEKEEEEASAVFSEEVFWECDRSSFLIGGGIVVVRHSVRGGLVSVLGSFRVCCGVKRRLLPFEESNSSRVLQTKKKAFRLWKNVAIRRQP